MVELTQQNIIHFINHPDKVNKDQLILLNELAEKHPYSSFLNTLLAKVLHTQQHVGYYNQLQKAAFSITDRLVLYKYIQRKALLEKIKAVISDENSSNTAKTDPLTDTFPKTEDPELLELEKNILSTAINMSIQQESQIDKKEQADKKGKVKITPKIDFEKKSMPLSGWLTSPSSKETSRKNISTPNTSSIIDSFIKGEDTQTSPQPFFSAAESAKMSLIDDDEFVTETLAEIHVRQGNYAKAIKIYEQLMLNIPEKKIYFASRIKYIKEKSNYS